MYMKNGFILMLWCRIEQPSGSDGVATQYYDVSKQPGALDAERAGVEPFPLLGKQEKALATSDSA